MRGSNDFPMDHKKGFQSFRAQADMRLSVAEKLDTN